MVDELLNNSGIIRSSSVVQETSLIWSNDARKKGLDSIGYDFCDDLVLRVTKSYRSKVLKGDNIGTLRD